ncbi:hypothetical protein SOVF_147190 [Spinacia oleracea]|uniref:Uncharacterized protein At1g05835 n=1 Tax=Spinacia oleracea TaxID=3562 RepID=A0ABM3QLF3_SPIOL|nr:uncharacterized protein At1g05835 [Spinacia oleracea]KNA10136.1 hypothetical protein SOVF_147190 [Spinacia oleracea]
MEEQSSAMFKLLFCSSLVVIAFLLPHTHGKDTISRCVKNVPSVKQTQVGKGKYRVDVKNNCGTCPVIDVHVKCGNFSQSEVDPKLFKVLKFDDCVVNYGLPLLPLQIISFNYTHPTKYPLHPNTWYFQCE